MRQEHTGVADLRQLTTKGTDTIVLGRQLL